MTMLIKEFEQMAKDREFEASDELESWLKRLSSADRANMQKAMDCAFEKGYQQAQADEADAE
ncbi:hypothetical protein RYA05_03165 [Pseudomonas syringae pv. actinidiae]|nr:hypothetical protein [Pseudomonas syringae pv. actinidiae]